MKRRTVMAKTGKKLRDRRSNTSSYHRNHKKPYKYPFATGTELGHAGRPSKKGRE